MASDIISLAALYLNAIVGPDHWHRTRPQPARLTIHLHLAPSFLDTSGQSDSVTDSLHYGHLAKAVERRVGGRTEGYASAGALVEDATNAAFQFSRDAVENLRNEAGAEMEVVRAVRVVLELPKQILLAGGFEIEATTRASEWSSRSRRSAIVRVTNLVLPVLVGVNPPERLAKQRVLIDLTFLEGPFPVTDAVTETKGHGAPHEIDYPSVVQQIATDVEASTYLTLERLVYEIIHTAYRISDAQNPGSATPRIDAITVRCQKPSALSFADASGVEMTRVRKYFNSGGGG